MFLILWWCHDLNALIEKALAIPLQSNSSYWKWGFCGWKISSHAKTFGINSLNPNFFLGGGGVFLLDKGYVWAHYKKSSQKMGQ